MTDTRKNRGRPKSSNKKHNVSIEHVDEQYSGSQNITKTAIGRRGDNRWFPTEEAKETARAALETDYQRQIEHSIEVMGPYGENHITAISVAMEIMKKIINGDERIIVIAPTLSGKTSIMKSLAKFQRAIIKVNCLVYHCAVNFLENRRQTTERLALEQVKVCSLKERRRSTEVIAPSLTIYDETQVGQKPDQTLAKAFQKSKTFHTQGSVTVAFSATPNTVLAGGMFSQVWIPIKQWIDGGYCDVKYLIDSRRLIDADPIFHPVREGNKQNGKIVDWEINSDANALLHLIEILSKSEKRHGFSLIRLPKKMAEIAAKNFLKHLESKGLLDNASVVFYTEENPDLGPGFFHSNPADQHCIVFLKNKLSVGVDLDTRWIRLFYEYSPRTTIESFAQSAAGRVSGWGKQKHECVVYTSMRHAEVYSTFFHEGWDSYIRAAEKAGLQVSSGVKIVSDISREVDDLATYIYPDNVSVSQLKQQVKQQIHVEFGLKVDTTRTLSATRFDYGNKANPVWTPNQPAKDFRPSNRPWTVTVNVMDRYHPSLERQKDWDGSIVRAIQTTDRIIEAFRAETHKSIHSPEFFV